MHFENYYINIKCENNSFSFSYNVIKRSHNAI